MIATTWASHAVSAGGRLKTLACDQTASGAQARSDVVILNVAVEYRRLAAAGVDGYSGHAYFTAPPSVKRRPCADSLGALDRPVLHASTGGNRKFCIRAYRRDCARSP